MVRISERSGVDAVSIIQDIAVEGFCKGINLPSLLRLREITELDGKIAQGHYHKPGAVLARAAGHT